MKSIQNKMLLGMLLVSVASANAMYPDNLQFDVDPIVPEVVVAPQPLSRMEKVTGAFKSAGSSVVSGASAVAEKTKSGLTAAKDAVVSGSKSAFGKTKDGVVSAYNYVGDKVSPVAKVASEKAGQVWNYNKDVTFRGQNYAVPAGKIGVGLAAAGIAYGVYKMVAKRSQSNNAFVAFDSFYSVVNAQAELCKQAAVENKRVNVTNVLNEIMVAYKQLSIQLVRLANTEKDAEYMQSVVLPVLFEYVRAVEFACQGLEYTFTVSENGRIAKSQLSHGFFVGNAREMLIAESMVFLSSYMEEFLKPLAQDVLNNGSEKSPSLVARAKSVLANVASSTKSAAVKAQNAATVAKAAVVTKVQEHPYISAGVATAAVAGGAYAAYKTGYYPTVAGVKAAGNKAVESTKAGYKSAKTAVVNTATSVKNRIVSAPKVEVAAAPQSNVRDVNAETAIMNDLANALSQPVNGAPQGTPAPVVAQEQKPGFAARAFTSTKNAFTTSTNAIANAAVVSKDAVKNAAITTKNAVVAHPYKTAGIAAGTFATAGSSYAGYKYIKSDKRQITIALNTLLAKAQEAVYSNVYFVPQENDSMVQCLMQASLFEGMIPAINQLNYAIEARNQNNTMKAYVTLKQYVASVIDNLDAILAPQVQEEVVQEQVKPSMKARVGSFFNRMLPVSKSELSVSAA